MSDGFVAIVPARGGSKRLPRKNVLPVAGRPMLAWPIAAALASGLFERVIVSTDDAEIGRAGEAAGGRALARPAGLATDTATIAEVCLHVLDALAAEGAHPTAFCCLLPTAVFVTAADVRSAHALLDAAPAGDVVLGVSPYLLHPFKALVGRDGYATSAFPDRIEAKSQGYPAFHASNGTLIWARAAVFRARPAFYVDRLKTYVMDPLKGLDVDTAEDLERARRLAGVMLG